MNPLTLYRHDDDQHDGENISTFFLLLISNQQYESVAIV